MLKHYFYATFEISNRKGNKFLMKPHIMKLFYFILFVVFSGVHNVNAEKNQVFEGLIRIVEFTQTDTIYYDFKIKDQLTAVLMHDKHNSVHKKFLANTEKNVIYEINDEQKVYIEYKLEQKKINEEDKDKITVKQTDNYKIIDGIKCYQWIVTNKAKNTSISYWIAKQDFAFLFSIIQNIKEASNKRASYFMFIPDYKDFFPYESIERGLLREFRAQEQLVSVKIKKLPDSYFEIPKDYKELK